MNIASALLKQIIVQKDLDTWSKLKEHYLPGEYQPIFHILDKHIDNYQDLPKFEDLSYEVRDRQLQEKISAIETVEVEVDAWLLLDYLKNEYAQVQILDELDNYKQFYTQNSVIPDPSCLVCIVYSQVVWVWLIIHLSLIHI